MDLDTYLDSGRLPEATFRTVPIGRDVDLVHKHEKLTGSLLDLKHSYFLHMTRCNALAGTGVCNCDDGSLVLVLATGEVLQ